MPPNLTSEDEKGNFIDLQALREARKKRRKILATIIKFKKLMKNIKLQRIVDKVGKLKARVQRVHVNGLGRTKDDIVINSVGELFQASDFQTVVLKIHEARSRLEGLGCFKGVSVLIDTYEGPDAVQDGLEVTFEVKELNLAGARINTAIGVNEAIASGGGALRNVFGRGEELNASYSHGNKRTSTFAANYVKPFHSAARTELTTSLYQSYMEAGWSSYKEVDRGLLMKLSFRPSHYVSQYLAYNLSWRHLSCLSRSAAFAVREHSGPSLKSSLQHQVSLDTRDDSVFPNDGMLLRIKVAQCSLSAGHLRTAWSKSYTLADRFTLGGPMSLRGFQIGGVGPHSENCALGGDVYWKAGLHLFTPLPFLKHGTFVDRFKLHFWSNVGNVCDFQRELETSLQQKLAVLARDTRFSYGAGIALNLAGIARVELNYCLPLIYKRWDKHQAGLQFGIAADVL